VNSDFKQNNSYWPGFALFFPGWVIAAGAAASYGSEDGLEAAESD
jgi:hypothetical protein